ncbi:MAG: phosphatase PAP2 family protein [Candidatus Acidiferrales bacterium]
MSSRVFVPTPVSTAPAFVSSAGILAALRRATGAFEWVTLAYFSWLISTIVIFHRHLPRAAGFVALHLAILAAIALLALAAARWRNPLLRFARSWYPLPLYIFCFEELERLVHIIFSGWFDRFLIAFDFNLAGVHPSIYLARFSSPPLNDFMQFAYMTYFLYLIILPALLYAARERVAFWTVMASTAIAHNTVYAISILFPTESPYFALASLQTKTLTGGFFTRAIGLIEHFGRVHGAAFPSAHVAGSMVAILAARRYRPWLFWICLPFFVAMCVSTVYGRYHYVADVIAGLAVGAFAWIAGQWLMQCPGALPRSTTPSALYGVRRLAAAFTSRSSLRRSLNRRTTPPHSNKPPAPLFPQSIQPPDR